MDYSRIVEICKLKRIVDGLDYYVCDHECRKSDEDNQCSLQKCPVYDYKQRFQVHKYAELGRLDMKEAELREGVTQYNVREWEKVIEQKAPLRAEIAILNPFMVRDG